MRQQQHWTLHFLQRQNLTHLQPLLDPNRRQRNRVVKKGYVEIWLELGTLQHRTQSQPSPKRRLSHNQRAHNPRIKRQPRKLSPLLHNPLEKQTWQSSPQRNSVGRTPRHSLASDGRCRLTLLQKLLKNLRWASTGILNYRWLLIGVSLDLLVFHCAES